MRRKPIVVEVVLLLLLVATTSRAADHVVAGTQLAIHSGANGHGAMSLVLRDAAIPVGAPGSSSDPSLGSTIVTLFGRRSGDRVSFVAAAGPNGGTWKVQQTSRAIRYLYADPGARASAVRIRSSQLRTGAGWKVRTVSPGLALAIAESAVAVRIAWGTERVCAVFDGAAVHTSKRGAFAAHGAAPAAISDCDDTTLGQQSYFECGGIAPACDGECPPNFICQGSGPADPTCTCVYTGPCPGGCPDGWICAFPMSGGSCLPPFCSGVSPACDGTCDDPAAQCVATAGLCFCLTPCDGGSPAPICGGSCSDPKATCRSVDDGCYCT